MKSRDFVYWLQGFIEIADPKRGEWGSKSYKKPFKYGIYPRDRS
jgi:hypothetical protein